MASRLNLLQDTPRELVIDGIGTRSGLTIFTPNVDHLVQSRKLGLARQYYLSNETNLLDSRPLDKIARLAGKKLCYFPGSDLFDQLVKAYGGQAKAVAIVGGNAGSQSDALRHLAPGWSIDYWNDEFHAWTDADSVTLPMTPALLEADLVFVFLGFPKQEWVARAIRRAGARGNILCLGAALDFAVGRAIRAPKWMRSLGLEWLHRAATQPRRLAPRYLRDAIGLPKAVSTVLRARVCRWP